MCVCAEKVRGREGGRGREGVDVYGGDTDSIYNGCIVDLMRVKGMSLCAWCDPSEPRHVRVRNTTVFAAYTCTWTFFVFALKWQRNHPQCERYYLPHNRVSVPPSARFLHQEMSWAGVKSASVSQEESFGFMDCTADEWELKKQNHQLQLDRQRGTQSDNGGGGFQSNWEPTWSCGLERRIGEIGDGGKWLCDPHKIRKSAGCNVISIGSNKGWGFEAGIHELAPGCRIHVFGDATEDRVVYKPDYVSLHTGGMVEKNTEDTDTIQSLFSAAGLSGQGIDVLRFDCEGCQLKVYKELTKTSATQILMKVHMGTRHHNSSEAGLVNAIFEHMSASGYVIFHKETSHAVYQGGCVEYSLIKLNLRGGSA